MKPCKLVPVVVCAVAVLAALASSASARNISSSSQSTRATWTRMDFSGGFGTIECEVTLEGSYHSRTIAKAAGVLIGYITAATVGNTCRRGGATVLRETLPWHVTYSGFAGTLPNITDINTNVIGASFQLREPSFGITCLAKSTSGSPFLNTLKRIASGVINAIITGGSTVCIGAANLNISFGGTSTTVTTSTGSSITVTLI